MKSSSKAGLRNRMQTHTNGGQTVLGAALGGEEEAAETLEAFGDDLLLGASDQRIGRAICSLRRGGTPIGPLTLLLELDRLGELNGRAMERLQEVLDGRTGEDARRRLKTETERARKQFEEVGFDRREEDGDGLVFLREIIENPELYQPPATVVDRMAWEGRVSLLAGREKLGKSTLISAAAAAASNGEPLFDADPDRSGCVLYFGLEEALADVGRRAVRCGANPDRLVFARPHHVAPFERLEKCVEKLQPALVLVDSLAAFTQQLELEPGNSAHWTRVMTRFTNLARKANTALVLVHHARKRDGRYRDSTAIGAGVDMILEMSKGDAENEREVSARGRWALEDYSFVLRKSEERLWYELSDDGQPLEARIVRWVQTNPGCSSRKVREEVRGKADAIANALHQLEDDGSLENRGGRSRHEWYLPKADS